jgi:sec-independent protein translocase protein TatA
MHIGPTELVIVLVIVILLFGIGRVSKLGGELGGAVANFRRGMQEGAKAQPGSEGRKPETEEVKS